MRAREYFLVGARGGRGLNPTADPNRGMPASDPNPDPERLENLGEKRGCAAFVIL